MESRAERVKEESTRPKGTGGGRSDGDRLLDTMKSIRLHRSNLVIMHSECKVHYRMSHILFPIKSPVFSIHSV